jgi:hypothetical protein
MSDPIFSTDEAERPVLKRVRVRLVTSEVERARWDAIIEEKHYLKSARRVGEQLRYVAEVDGEWVALLGWSAASYHLRQREAWIGWNDEQRRQRLPFVANNARFLILDPGRWPNLGSQVLALCTARLSPDWQAVYGHDILAVESFVDSQLFGGTTYQANGWEALGQTAGFERVVQDFYVAHERPKQLWVKALEWEGRGWLRAESLPPALAEQLTALIPKCRMKAPVVGSLWERLHHYLPDQRSAEGLRHKQATILTIVLLALMCGVRGGYGKLEHFARGLNQGQRRRLRCWRNPRTGRFEVPDETTFFRVLKSLDPVQLGQLLVQWETDRFGWKAGGLLTARLIVQSAGGDYILTIKGNQKGLPKTAQTLLPEGVPPSTPGDRDQQSRSPGTPGHHRALNRC